MRKKLRARAIGMLLGLVIAAGHLVYVQTDYAQLSRLERRARAVPFRDAGFRDAAGQASSYWQVRALEHRLEHLGARIEYAEVPPGYKGMTYPDRRIVIDQTMSWNSRLVVLAHEGAHLLAPESTAEDGAREVFCDAVSFLVARRFGIDIYEPTAHHLAMYKDSLHALEDFRAEIKWAVDVLGGP